MHREYPRTREPQSWVPVVSSTGKPLMPCHPKRAREMMERGKAQPRWLNGIFYIQLLHRADGEVQHVSIGIDPGSSREAMTIMTKNNTIANLHIHAYDGKGLRRVIETRRAARRARRYRNRPNRKCRPNRRQGSRTNWTPPTTKARWNLKLRILRMYTRIVPISVAVVEDVYTELKEGQKRRNLAFSAVQNGKNYFYRAIEALGISLITRKGCQTAAYRRDYGLEKDKKNKLLVSFFTHCVDSWVLAREGLLEAYGALWSSVKLESGPEHTKFYILKPLYYTRRQLHKFNPVKNGAMHCCNRARYGGTVLRDSDGNTFYKGTLVKHPKYGITLVSGYSRKTGFSLSVYTSNDRLCRNAKAKDMEPIARVRWSIVRGGATNYNQPWTVKLDRLVQRSHKFGSRWQEALNNLFNERRRGISSQS